MYFDYIFLKSCQEILIRLFKITKIDFFLLYTITIMIILADFSIILSQRWKKVNKYLHTLLMASFGVLDPQLVSKFLLAQDFSLSKIALKLLTSVLNERPPCMPISVYYIKCLFLKKIRFIFEKRPFKLGSAILLSTESSWVMKTLQINQLFDCVYLISKKSKQCWMK